MTCSALAALCNRVIGKARQACVVESLVYQSGAVKFRLCETAAVMQCYADQHFAKVAASEDANTIFLLTDESLSDEAHTFFPEKWFQKSIDALHEIGIYGYFDDANGTLEFFDPATRVGLRLLRSRDDTPPWDGSSPVVNMVNWMNAAQRNVMLHAACLSHDGVGALLMGPSGSGKSLLTVAGLQLGMQSVGDDYAIVERLADGSFVARPYSGSGKQTPEGLALLDDFDPAILGTTRNWQNKHVFGLGIDFETVLPVAMTIAPTIGKTKRITAAKPAQMYRTLIESTLAQLPATVRQTTELAAMLIRERPVFAFEMGGNVADNAAYLRDFLKDYDPDA